MDIVLLKKQLNAAGFGPLATEGPEANLFGPKTTEAVKKFQAAHGLVVDGKVGPATLAALEPGNPAPKDKYHIKGWTTSYQSLGMRALQIAQAQVGVREVPQNSGPAVETFLASVGLGPGFSWCMAFVYWCVDQAARGLGIQNPLVRTGGCLRQWNETILKKSDTPKAGDIFIMDLGGGNGHTGIVLAVRGDTIDTVEGNTNNDGSANGDGVYQRTRKVARMKGFISLDK